VAEAPTQDRVVLIGTPSLLQGQVRVSNPGQHKLKIKTARLSLDGAAADGVHVALDARLAAGATQHASATLRLDPRTPPGELRGRVDVGGEEREVVIKVLEHREVGLAPDRFAIHGPPGASVQVPLHLTNLGNVPFDVPRVALVALGQANAFEQLFHTAVAEAGSGGYQAALDVFARMLQGAEVAAPKVLFGEGAGQALAPGAALETTLTFELPAGLARHRLYLGSFHVGRTQCAVEIEVDTPALEDASTPSAPRAAKKP